MFSRFVMSLSVRGCPHFGRYVRKTEIKWKNHTVVLVLVTHNCIHKLQRSDEPCHEEKGDNFATLIGLCHTKKNIVIKLSTIIWGKCLLSFSFFFGFCIAKTTFTTKYTQIVIFISYVYMCCTNLHLFHLVPSFLRYNRGKCEKHSFEKKGIHSFKFSCKIVKLRVISNRKKIRFIIESKNNHELVKTCIEC